MIEVTAQPIAEDGTIGFEERGPLVVEVAFTHPGLLIFALEQMARKLEEFPEVDAWDLTVVKR